MNEELWPEWVAVIEDQSRSVDLWKRLISDVAWIPEHLKVAAAVRGLPLDDPEEILSEAASGNADLFADLLIDVPAIKSQRDFADAREAVSKEGTAIVWLDLNLLATMPEDHAAAIQKELNEDEADLTKELLLPNESPIPATIPGLAILHSFGPSLDPLRAFVACSHWGGSVDFTEELKHGPQLSSSSVLADEFHVKKSIVEGLTDWVRKMRGRDPTVRGLQFYAKAWSEISPFGAWFRIQDGCHQQGPCFEGQMKAWHSFVRASTGDRVAKAMLWSGEHGTQRKRLRPNLTSNYPVTVRALVATFQALGHALTIDDDRGELDDASLYLPVEPGWPFLLAWAGFCRAVEGSSKLRRVTCAEDPSYDWWQLVACNPDVSTSQLTKQNGGDSSTWFRRVKEAALRSANESLENERDRELDVLGSAPKEPFVSKGEVSLDTIDIEGVGPGVQWRCRRPEGN